MHKFIGFVLPGRNERVEHSNQNYAEERKGREDQVHENVNQIVDLQGRIYQQYGHQCEGPSESRWEVTVAFIMEDVQDS